MLGLVLILHRIAELAFIVILYEASNCLHHTDVSALQAVGSCFPCQALVYCYNSTVSTYTVLYALACKEVLSLTQIHTLHALIHTFKCMHMRTTLSHTMCTHAQHVLTHAHVNSPTHPHTHTEDLLDKWNVFEGAFKSLTDWIMDEAQRFSDMCTNKKEYGVVEHMDACDVRKNGKRRGGKGYSLIQHSYCCECMGDGDVRGERMTLD